MITEVSSDGTSVQLTCDRPIKGLVLDVEGSDEGVKWGDQAIDLIPGDKQTIKSAGLAGKKISARYLGSDSA